jgi:glycosyltransferase involved in cell wall biosynthesis
MSGPGVSEEGAAAVSGPGGIHDRGHLPAEGWGLVQFPEGRHGLERPRPSEQSSRALRIAMIGQRGVPATFGGVERHVEEIGARLVQRGHEVTVFCRDGYADAELLVHRGMRLRHLPAMPMKHFEAISHSVASATLALGRRFDVVHYHAVGPGLASPLTRYLSGARVVLTVHGLDGQREKWGAAASRVLGLATWLSARVPHATVVVSKDLAAHYRTTYGRETEWITNGVERAEHRPAGEFLRGLGLTPGGYLLFVGRLVPEKAPDVLLRAFAQVPDPDARLVIAGGSSFTDGYEAELKQLASADPRVILPGYVYGDSLRELYSGAGAFVLPSNLEGLPLTLLEAASYALPLVVSDISPHLEVVGADGPGRRVFPRGDAGALAATLTAVLAGLPAERGGAVASSREILARHDWGVVTDRTEALYHRILGRPAPPPSRIVLPDTDEAAALRGAARPAAEAPAVIDLRDMNHHPTDPT